MSKTAILVELIQQHDAQTSSLVGKPIPRASDRAELSAPSPVELALAGVEETVPKNANGHRLVVTTRSWSNSGWHSGRLVSTVVDLGLRICSCRIVTALSLSNFAPALFTASWPFSAIANACPRNQPSPISGPPWCICSWAACYSGTGLIFWAAIPSG